MIKKLTNIFILWCVRRSKWTLRVHGYEEKLTSFYRYCPLWYDEWTGEDGVKHNRPPWYRPFNILLHRWVTDDNASFHDHPRWSITICLRGKLIERTPWGDKVLTPGSVTIRSHKFIHHFEVPHECRGKTWTLFIVGRRNYRQNDYFIKAFDKEY